MVVEGVDGRSALTPTVTSTVTQKQNNHPKQTQPYYDTSTRTSHLPGIKNISQPTPFLDQVEAQPSDEWTRLTNSPPAIPPSAPIWNPHASIHWSFCTDSDCLHAKQNNNYYPAEGSRRRNRKQQNQPACVTKPTIKN